MLFQLDHNILLHVFDLTEMFLWLLQAFPPSMFAYKILGATRMEYLERKLNNEETRINQLAEMFAGAQ